MKLSLSLLDNLQHIFCEGGRRIVISSGIVRSLRNNNGLDFLVIGMDGETLASANDTYGGWTSVGHFHTEGLGELGGGVGDKCDHGSFDALIFAPSLHNSRIVHTVNDNLLDSGGLEFFLFLKVSRNLLCGSGGGECSGETHKDDILSGAVVGDVNLLNIGESLHYLNRGKGRECHFREGAEVVVQSW